MSGRKNPTPRRTLPPIALCALVFLTACGGERAVFLGPDTVVRAGPGMRGLVWMPTADGWVLSKNKVEIPEGMYILTLSHEEETDLDLPSLLPTGDPR